MRAALALAAIVVALTLQTTIAGLGIGGAVAVDFVLVVVVYVGLTMGPIAGLAAGTVAGLAQDALSSGILGIGGLAKTIAGFYAGIVGTQFILTQPVPRFVVYFSATVLHAVAFMGLYVVLDLRHFTRPFAAVAVQGAGNALLGVIACHLIDSLPGAAERRRSARGRMRVTRLRR